MKFVLTIWHKETYSLDRDYDDLDDAYDYAEVWLRNHPKDIVMMTVVRTDICKNCRVAIREIPGAIIHKWQHESGNRVCFNKELTRAEPREVTA